MMISRYKFHLFVLAKQMLVESSAVERRLSPGHRLHLTVIFFSFHGYKSKGCEWDTGLELSLTGQIKITHNISGCPGQFGTVGNPTCTYVIAYLSVLT